MASYFESINDALTVQINDDFTNYALWKKGRVTSSPGPAAVTRMFYFEFPLPASGGIPIVVFDTTPGSGVMVLSQSFKGGMARIVAYSTLLINQDTLTYYVYISASEPEVSVQPKGLFTLWNADGRVVFDSEANYLKVLDSIQQHWQAAPVSRSYPVKKVGVVSSRAQWYVNPADSPGGWRQFAGCAVLTGVGGSPNSITSGYYLLRQTTVGNQWPNPSDSGNSRRSATMNALICDISNLDDLPYDIIS